MNHQKAPFPPVSGAKHSYAELAELFQADLISALARRKTGKTEYTVYGSPNPGESHGEKT